ncbi:MAG: Arginine--tRNA ligase [Syntrophus sp. SKADARSKE-3]|nr:Arginine--tRNA ligase [Syntrophus sp. SKADARSKE-3]
MKNRIIKIIEEALRACVDEGALDIVGFPSIEIEAAKEEIHGDYASNIAMVLASKAKKNPRQIAGLIKDHIRESDGILKKIEIAGPGFLNFFIREEIWAASLEAIERDDGRYGMVQLGHGEKIQVEFVSANPTGPLHIGHARGAVVGDVMANILSAVGYDVFREYYINDAGNQMHNLGRSVFYRYQGLTGKAVSFPDNCYQGDYIRDLAQEILDRDGLIYAEKTDAEVVPFFTDYAAGSILEGIKEDLKSFGVVFDLYFSERELYRDDGVENLLVDLERQGFIYREDGTRWFKTTIFGDEKDRVVVRQNGEPTYFAADIAYHRNKFSRGFKKVIDIWGADHHGYIPRMQAGIQALGYEREALKVILVQLVNLLRDGVPVAMSTRSGEFVTMKEVGDEVGRDAVRYNILMRRSDSHLDFDLEVAKRQSNENPVYYVQYAHARISSILRLAEEKGYAVPKFKDADCHRLTLPEEIALIKLITRFPELVEGTAKTLEPHRLTFYLHEVAALFHSYYNKCKVVSDDDALTRARLLLVVSVRTVLKNALTLLGVSAPEKM